MNKNELKQARKELVYMMHLLREKQEVRKNKIMENKNPGEKYNFEIDKILMKLMTNNGDYYFNTPTEEDKKNLDELITDIKKMKKKK